MGQLHQLLNRLHHRMEKLLRTRKTSVLIGIYIAVATILLAILSTFIISVTPLFSTFRKWQNYYGFPCESLESVHLWHVPHIPVVIVLQYSQHASGHHEQIKY